MISVDGLIKNNNSLVKGGFIFLGLSLLLFFLWGSFAKLESASIASGVIIVESNKKSIQHLEGGIVSQVYVHEGQTVKKNQPLIKISNVSYYSNFKQLKLQWISNQLKYQRLVAERENALIFTPNVDSQDMGLEVRTIMTNQRALFNSRVDMRRKELEIVKSRHKQAIRSKLFYEQMLIQKKKALTYLSDEINMHSKLLADGYTSKLKVLELKRSEVLLASDVISIQSSIDEAQSSIEEFIRQISAIKERNRSEIENQIAEAKGQLISLKSELKTAQDRQERTVIRSPSEGIVLGLQVHSAGEVISPGKTLLQIVPDNDELLIEALIKPTDIDSVKKGQKALVRLSAYNYRTTPVLHGKVIYIDADRTVINQGENTKSGFKIKVKLDRNDLIHNKEFNLYPGMPADVYVILKEKSPLDYLLEPFEQSLFRAFRES